MFFAGDFNAKSHFWWPDGDETLEGREIEKLCLLPFVYHRLTYKCFSKSMRVDILKNRTPQMHFQRSFKEKLLTAGVKKFHTPTNLFQNISHLNKIIQLTFSL